LILLQGDLSIRAINSGMLEEIRPVAPALQKGNLGSWGQNSVSKREREPSKEKLFRRGGRQPTLLNLVLWEMKERREIPRKHAV